MQKIAEDKVEAAEADKRDQCMELRAELDKALADTEKFKTLRLDHHHASNKMMVDQNETHGDKIKQYITET